MGRPKLPPGADHAADPAVHIPNELPAVPTAPPSHVTLPDQALEALAEHVDLLGQGDGDLPEFFSS